MSHWGFTLIFFINIVSPVLALKWLNKPPTLYQCEGDAAPFLWDYKTSPEDQEVTSIRYLNLVTGETILATNVNGMPNVSETYKDRVAMTSFIIANAGLILRELTEKDTGTYRVELAGPDANDEAELHVYSVDSLEPTLFINSQNVALGGSLIVQSSEDFHVTLRTSRSEYANINISANGMLVQNCKSSFSCDVSLDPSQYPMEICLTFTLEYRMCDIIKKNFSISVITTTAPSTTTEHTEAVHVSSRMSKFGLAVLVIFISLCIIIGAIFITWLIFSKDEERKKKSKFEKWFSSKIGRHIDTLRIWCLKELHYIEEDYKSVHRKQEDEAPAPERKRLLTKDDICVIIPNESDKMDDQTQPTNVECNSHSTVEVHEHDEEDVQNPDSENPPWMQTSSSTQSSQHSVIENIAQTNEAPPDNSEQTVTCNINPPDYKGNASFDKDENSVSVNDNTDIKTITGSNDNLSHSSSKHSINNQTTENITSEEPSKVSFNTIDKDNGGLGNDSRTNTYDTKSNLSE